MEVDKSCSIHDLVVGDVVHLMTGDIVPTDGIFIKGYNLLVDESSLTGECEPVNVNETDPFLFSGTKVQDGSGKMLVASVGMKTYLGSLMGTMSQIGENETPLQVKLNAAELRVAIAVTVLVVGIPEVSAQIKQGTLTTNRMVVDRLLICDEVLLNKDAPDFLKSAKYESVLDILLHSIFLNSGSEVVQRKDGTNTVLVGISDPVRPEVKSAVQTCLAAGITVRMVTGDNINTAKAIAKECGILTDDGLAIEGSALRAILLQQFQELMPKLQVWKWWLDPHLIDKFTLVTKLKSDFGEVIAVTGDGTNDASALRAADVGLAMGIAGTEVARESADVVLMDDNFTTIVNLIRWGRLVYQNIQLLVQFQLTISIVALVFNFFSACISGSAPLTVVQLLWVNMISDILGVLALVTKLPCDKVFNEINSQEIEKINVFRGLLDSWVFATGIACIVVCQIVVVEFLGPFAHTKPLGWRLWFVSVLIGFLSMPVSVLLKCITASKLVGAINRWKCYVPPSYVPLPDSSFMWWGWNVVVVKMVRGGMDGDGNGGAG
ncbi:autoinhibited Ca(2+)-ATPase, isoform 4 [Actinidia rufa]|uniref:P-type Cu(+) transporter n=1 Tax=Actinidia rufa TaxID=165716 RepID=A0A7J0DB01_9ERIC|nr:autoinhibited Ca(2+)-ATPase, isoform 4 [Actinidia rufa]